MRKGARRRPSHPLNGPARRAQRALRPSTGRWALFAALFALSTAAVQAAPEGHCLAAGAAGGCVAGKVTDAGGILLPGMHVHFTRPTTRYAHGVLGDGVEWGGLAWVQQGSAVHGPYAMDEIVLPETRVFEDLAPRLHDLDADGVPEIVVVESDAVLGAQLAVYGLRNARLTKLAATPHIGRAFRWLAPAGVADLDGDGAVEIAYVDRPHLAKVLRVWRYRGGVLTEVAAAAGLTNHRIGDNFISGGIRDCGQGPEMVLADGGWARVVAVRLVDGALQARALGVYSPEGVASALNCR